MPLTDGTLVPVPVCAVCGEVPDDPEPSVTRKIDGVYYHFLPPVWFACVEVVVHAIDLACDCRFGIVWYFTAYLAHGHRYKRSISKWHLLRCHAYLARNHT